MYGAPVRRGAFAVLGAALAVVGAYALLRPDPGRAPSTRSEVGNQGSKSAERGTGAARASPEALESRAEAGWLAGRVTSGGAPVPGAAISLLRIEVAGSPSPVSFETGVQTDEDGRFRLPAEPGRLRVLAEAPGYAVGESREVWLRPGAELTSLLVELGRDGKITVSVRTEDDQPVKGATVEALGLSHWQLAPATTDARGQVIIPRVPPGELRFRVRASGLSSAESAPVTVAPGAHHELTVVLAPLLGISGRVVNTRGEPVAGAQVQLRPSAGATPALSEKDGSFRFEGLEEGLYALEAQHPRHGPSEPKTAASGESEVELVLTRGGELAGRVERADGTPAQHFFVVVDRFVPRGGEAQRGRPFKPVQVRGGDGSFVFPDLAPGTYDLVADAPSEGGPATATNVEVAAGVRTSGLVLKLGPGGELEGVVLEASGGPVPDADVRLQDAARSSRQLPPQAVKSDALGRFRFVGLGAGRRSVHVRKKGYVSRVAAGVNVSVGQTARVEVVLPKLAEGEKPKTEFYGIGAVLEQQKDGALVIQKLMDGAPSAQFGLQQGDRILSVDGEETARLGMERAVELIRGEEGTSVELEVLRTGDAYPFRVRIDRGRVSYEDR